MEGKALRLLVVEDDLYQQESMIKTLAEHKPTAQVEAVSSWGEALRKLIENEYDVLLLDFDLAGKEGLEVLKKIQRRGYSTPVVIVVERGQEEAAAQSLVPTFDYIIRTEGYLAMMPLAVERALERHRLLTEYQKKEESLLGRDRQLAALSAIAEAMSQPLDLGQILAGALSKVLEMMAAEAGGIYILDEITEDLIPLVQRGLTYTFAQNTAALKRSEILARRVIQLGTPILMEDISLEGEKEAHPGRGYFTTSVLLKSKGKALGVLNLFTSKRVAVPREVELLITISNQLGAAIENARLREGADDYIEKLEKSNEVLQELNLLLEESQAELEEQLSALRQAEMTIQQREAFRDVHKGLGYVALTVSRSLDLNEVLDDAMDRVLEATKAEAGGIFLLDEGAKQMALVAQRGLPETFLQAHSRVSIEAQKGPDYFASILLADQAVLVENIAGDTEARKVWAEADRKGLRSLVSVPLRARDRVLGIMSALTRGSPFTPEEAKLLTIVGDQVGLAIDNARLYDEAQRSMASLKASNEMLQDANARLEEGQEELEGLLAAMMEAEAEIQQYYKELWTLNAIAETISGSLNLDEILNSAVSKTVAAMEVEAGWVYLLDEEDKELRLRAHQGLPEKLSRGLVGIRLGEDLNELVVRDGKSITTENITEDARFAKSMTAMEGFRSLAAVPLKVKDRVLGIMGVTSPNHRQFSTREVQLLTSIGNQVALAIENARLYEEARQSAKELEQGNEVLQELNVLLEESQAELEEQITALKKAEGEIQQRNSELSALNAIAEVLNQSLDFEKVSIDALDKVLGTMQLTYGEFFLYDEKTEEVSLRVHRGRAPDFAFKIEEFGLGEGVPGIVAQTRQPLVIEDLAQDPRFIRGLRSDDQAIPSRVLVAIPLMAQDRLVGAMDFFGTEERHFTPQDLALLTTIGHQVGVVVENARLFEEVKETAARLERANEELQELNRLKSDFIATVSHELRTPLASIMGYVDLMCDKETGPLNEEQLKYIGIIERNSDRLSRLINDILDISRIEAGRMDLMMTTLNLTDIIQDVAITMQPQAQVKELELEISLADGLPSTQGDPDRLKQVVVNLLSNAIKFTPKKGRVEVHCYGIKVGEGHVELLTTGPSPPIRTLSLGEGDWLLTSVKDTGMGIPKEALDRVFEKFYQAGGSATRREGGSGLGLSIARGIVRGHGGEIWVESAGQGQGSTFTFAIPIIEAVAKPTYEKELAPSQVGTLLVVDDDPDIVNLVRLYLEGEGYGVVTAYDGHTALQAAEEVKPMAIVLDLLMPDLDGFAVLERLKANPATRDTPVIIVSILADKDRGFSLGAVDYLTKPIDRQRLIASVRRFVQPVRQGIDLAPILVVDDDREIVGLIEVYLQGEGFPVVCAYDGYEALAKVREEVPSLIVLDVLMPEMDGFQVIQALKANSQTRQIPVIILTAKDLSEEERLSLQLGATKYLTKTLFSKERLLAEVRDLLGRLATGDNSQ